MDYVALAEEMLNLRGRLLQIPITRELTSFSKGELFVLNYLMTHAAPVHPKDLSRNLTVSTARIAALLKHLEWHGLITRAADPSDSRQSNVALTPAGKGYIEKKHEEVVSALAAVLEGLGPEDTMAYLRIQEKILQNFFSSSGRCLSGVTGPHSLPAAETSERRRNDEST